MQIKNNIKRHLQKIIQAFKNDTSYIILCISMGIAFVIGVLAERKNTDDRILKMQFECFKRKVGDFYYIDEIGNMEFRWRNN
jgi:hypothetical protein